MKALLNLIRPLRTLRRRFCTRTTEYSLYMDNNIDHRQSRTLDPHLHIKSLLNGGSLAYEGIHKRGLPINIDNIVSQSNVFNDLYAKLQNNIVALHELRSDKKDPNYLELTSAIKKLQEEVRTYSDSYILPALRLPCELDPCVEVTSKDIICMFKKPNLNFTPKPHLDLCSDIIYSPTIPTVPYSLAGTLSVLEQALIDYFISTLNQYQFQLCFNADFVKSVVIEGCALPQDHFHLIEDPKVHLHNMKTFLVGGASLAAFCALYSKSVLRNTLPVKLFTNGRNYKRVATPDGAFHQMTYVSGFIAYDHNSHVDIINELTMMFTQVYTSLGIHFKIEKIGAPLLKPFESLAYGVLMFRPASKEYIEVGRFSTCSDYISRRLLIMYQGKTDSHFANICYFELGNIENLVSCIVEGTQDDCGNYYVPNVLEPYMYGVDCKYVNK